MCWKILTIVLGIIVGSTIVYFLYPKQEKPVSVAEIVQEIREKPLEKYTIERLSQREFSPSKIQIGEPIAEEKDYASYMFYYTVDGKKVSGMLNIPTGKGEYPVIVMFRGYAPLESYVTGVGTKRGAEYFASHKFVTVSPDFLGYGESDDPSADVFEARFQTYTTALSLLSSIENLNDALSEKGIKSTIVPEKVGIWGHSNGGQIALTVLEISQKAYPTILWAPVSKPFPYSILYYTDEYDDYGKALRKDLARFESDYDADKYSLIQNLDTINAPIQLHQGLTDEEVPVVWSNKLVEKLKDLEKDVKYFTYRNADHNLMPDGWDPAISRAMDFYREKMEL